MLSLAVQDPVKLGRCEAPCSTAEARREMPEAAPAAQIEAGRRS